MIYLDSCVAIYAVEDLGERGRRVRDALRRATEDIAISPLVIHEALVHPLRRNDQSALDAFGAFFAACRVLEVESVDYFRAAELRAQAPGLKTVDALHLAVAGRGGCSALWTNDLRLSAVAGDLAVDVVA